MELESAKSTLVHGVVRNKQFRMDFTFTQVDIGCLSKLGVQLNELFICT